MQSSYYPQQQLQSYPSSQYYPQQPQPQFVMMMPGQPNLNQYGMKSQVELQPMGKLHPQLVVTAHQGH